jgi:TatD-related deoxyribonuclease
VKTGDGPLSPEGRKPPFPIFDAHMHLDPDGRNIEAAREFQRTGGTGLMLVSKPYQSIAVSSVEDFIRNFELTVRLAESVRSQTGLAVMVAIGPHPAELPRLSGQLGLEKAKETMMGAMQAAGKMVGEGKAQALGEIGRPHFLVEAALWEASNDILAAGLGIARELGCAAILHTETATLEVFAELAAMARKAGQNLERTVKHFSPPVVREQDNSGLFPSVLAGKGAFEKALSQGTRFMVETDYIDDNRRPGAVLGPATVPRRTLDLFSRGLLTEEQAYKIHRDNPEKVFGK